MMRVGKLQHPDAAVGGALVLQTRPSQALACATLARSVLHGLGAVSFAIRLITGAISASGHGPLTSPGGPMVAPWPDSLARWPARGPMVARWWPDEIGTGATPVLEPPAAAAFPTQAEPCISASLDLSTPTLR